MKSTITEPEHDKLPQQFPALYKWTSNTDPTNHFIVLKTKLYKGTVVAVSNNCKVWSVGHHAENWGHDNDWPSTDGTWQLFEGEVKITN